MAWTDEAVAKLRVLWDRGLSGPDIAAELGKNVSASAVTGKAHRLGLAARLDPFLEREAVFARVCDRVIEPPYMTIDAAAQAERMNPTVARKMWLNQIVATHGGDPR